MRSCCLLLFIFLSTNSPAPAHADPKAASRALPSTPRLLTATEMDQVTAGSLALRLDLAGMATGSTASASVEGEARIARASMLAVTPVAGAPPAARLRLRGTVTAEVALGTGRAFATGDGTTCSARADTIGEIAFIRSIAASVVNPGSSTCLCSVFAIAPVK